MSSSSPKTAITDATIHPSRIYVSTKERKSSICKIGHPKEEHSHLLQSASMGKQAVRPLGMTRPNSAVPVRLMALHCQRPLQLCFVFQALP